MNRIFLLGNLTKDPETITANNMSVCKFGLAVSRRFQKDEADFCDIVAFKGLADTCQTHLHKGNKVAIIGELRSNAYTTQDGAHRTSYSVVAEEVQFLTPKSDGNATQTKLTPVNDDEKLPF